MSAEQLLERREAERVAAERANGGKAVVKLSALMKYIMAKRAASKSDKDRRREKAQSLRSGGAKVRAEKKTKGVRFVQVHSQTLTPHFLSDPPL